MTLALSHSLQLDVVRQHFPALAGDWVYFDNAGGSQTLKGVVDRISEYLLTSDVQLGASYAVSQMAGQRVIQATGAVADLINAADPSEVVIGPSTSMLLRILSLCMSRIFSPGDEIIVTNADHEANISPWVDLKRQGVLLKLWRINPDTLEFDLDDLAALLTPRTRLVALTHCSNILGTINPIRQIADLVHAHGAWVCIDGVGYAAHRLIDVQAWDVDFYVFSFYKTYGPHLAALYGKRDLLLSIPGINHYFISEIDIPYKFQPGNVNYELTYSTLAIADYLSDLAQRHNPDAATFDRRQRFALSFDLIRAYEAVIGERLLSYLRQKPTVRIIGEASADPDRRVPTIAFVVDGVDSASIPPQIDPHQIGIRYGDFYAKRLIEDLGLAPQNGVVRVSMVHYNTLAEVDRLIDCFESVF